MDGGTIAMKTKPGKGTTVVVQLPTTESKDAGDE